MSFIQILKVWSLFLKNSTSQGKTVTDTKTVTIHCEKSSEMSKHEVFWRGDAKKGGICSGSCRLNRGVFGRRKRQGDLRNIIYKA